MVKCALEGADRVFLITGLGGKKHDTWTILSLSLEDCCTLFHTVDITSQKRNGLNIYLATMTYRALKVVQFVLYSPSKIINALYDLSYSFTIREVADFTFKYSLMLPRAALVIYPINCAGAPTFSCFSLPSALNSVMGAEVMKLLLIWRTTVKLQVYCQHRFLFHVF